MTRDDRALPRAQPGPEAGVEGVGGSLERAAFSRRAKAIGPRSPATKVAITMTASGISGAIGGAIVFAGLWMTTALPLGPSDRVIGLFTNAPPISLEALRGGAVVAALVGFVVGSVCGAIYELLHG